MSAATTMQLLVQSTATATAAQLESRRCTVKAALPFSNGPFRTPSLIVLPLDRRSMRRELVPTRIDQPRFHSVDTGRYSIRCASHSVTRTRDRTDSLCNGTSADLAADVSDHPAQTMSSRFVSRQRVTTTILLVPASPRRRPAADIVRALLRGLGGEEKRNPTRLLPSRIPRRD